MKIDDKSNENESNTTILENEREIQVGEEGELGHGELLGEKRHVTR
jgi:hypothetical protein